MLLVLHPVDSEDFALYLQELGKLLSAFAVELCPYLRLLLQLCAHIEVHQVSLLSSPIQLTNYKAGVLRPLLMVLIPYL